MKRAANSTVCLINLGCAKNLVDSEVLLGQLATSGYVPYPDLEKADIIIINTCGFIEPSRQESQRAIRLALKKKKSFPSKIVGVIGCYVEMAKEQLSRCFPQVDFWLGVKELGSLLEAIEGNKIKCSRYSFLYDDRMPRILSTPSVWAYVKIAEGCSHKCSFCTIPSIKGPYRSRSMASIVREVKDLVELGVKEVNLISQDTTYFGRDRFKRSQLSRLLEELIKIPKLTWIRWLYGFPEEVDDSLIAVMTDRKICPYFDLPFQHSHPQVLRQMRRGFSGHQALQLMAKIRKKIPDAVFRTSLIVGFPGEGQREFQDLLNFVREAEFDHLGVFLYSREKGTTAYKLGDPVPLEEKKRRKELIMSLQAEISRKKLSRFLGQRLEVLFDGTSNRQKTIFYGRSRYQAPEVDGVVKVTNFKNRKPPFPGIYLVEIIGYGQYDLRGKIIDDKVIN